MLIPRHLFTIIIIIIIIGGFFFFHLPFFVHPFVTTAATGLPSIPIQDEV